MTLVLLLVIGVMSLETSSGANIISSIISAQKQERKQCVMCFTRTHVRKCKTFTLKLTFSQFMHALEVRWKNLHIYTNFVKKLTSTMHRKGPIRTRSNRLPVSLLWTNILLSIRWRRAIIHFKDII